jgi:hypothetical protein
MIKGDKEMAMIEWGSPDWGGRVHYAENGSWVRDKHDKDKDKRKDKAGDGDQAESVNE